ncbi:MAG: hypothetical protein ACRCYO_13370 [Bacteroidia bacterium]
MVEVCILDAGVDWTCDDAVGGIEAGSILITQWENIETDWVPTDGEITVLNQAPGTSFYRFRAKSDTSDFLGTETHTPETGNRFDTVVITTYLAKMSKEKNVLFKLLSAKPLVIIMKDMQGVFHIFGLERGADKVGTNTFGSGKVSGDKSGYDIAFTSIQKNSYTVSSLVMADLVIDEAAS